MAFAEPKGLRTLEEEEKIDKAFSALAGIEKYIKDVNRENKTLCLRAFGHKLFCDCLSDNMPGPGMIVLSFYEYIAATTKSKEDLKYNHLPDDKKRVIDELRKTREKCVEELNR